MLRRRTVAFATVLPADVLAVPRIVPVGACAAMSGAADNAIERAIPPAVIRRILFILTAGRRDLHQHPGRSCRAHVQQAQQAVSAEFGRPSTVSLCAFFDTC